MPPDVCPNCGADVPPHAKACPECGSDESTGWSDHAHAANLGLPDDEFDYDEFVREEFGGGTKKTSVWKTLGWITVVIIVAVLVLKLSGILRF